MNRDEVLDKTERCGSYASSDGINPCTDSCFGTIATYAFKDHPSPLMYLPAVLSPPSLVRA